ncbi:1617_t:CDS:2 [Funneliformis geosporum]|uniref:tRNA(Ile)-lysidine synthetase n=1 Tax=Funneliformis geosporum TaxID=1117311 RepID=A0A9W4WN89_9GLOM|nr:1617_t:CDS:2 [Funneliformis geosporum]
MKIQIHQFPGVMTSLSKLYELHCTSNIDPMIFYGLAQICRFIEKFNITLSGDNPGLAILIEKQQRIKYLQLNLQYENDFYKENGEFESLYKIHIGNSLEFTIDALDLFFKKWQGRKPLWLSPVKLVGEYINWDEVENINDEEINICNDMIPILSISEKEFARIMSRFNLKYKERLGVAVSGGADSMALCYLLNQYCKISEHQITAFIIDHRLRRESTNESFQVSNTLSKLEIDNKIMRIQWKGQDNTSNSNLNDFNSPFPTKSQYETFARIERYKLLAKGCHENKISSLFVGHHLNDQLETLIMRLSRGSGIDGLASISMIDKFPVIRNVEAIGIQIVRPLLSVTKDRLIKTCVEASIPWIEDPSNQSTDHKRNIVRFSLDKLNKRYLIEGIREYEPLSTMGLSRFMNHMKDHKDFINSQDNGICSLSLPNPIPSSHWILKKYLATRIISRIIRFVRCSEHPPRLESTLKFYNHILSSYNHNITLNKVLLCCKKVHIHDSDTFENGSYNLWTFSRQPFTSLEETRNVINIQDGQVILWDNRFFIGLNLISHQTELCKKQIHQEIIPSPPRYYIRRLHDKDIYNISEENKEDQINVDNVIYKNIIEKYKRKVPHIARHNIPVVIKKSDWISLNGILHENENVVNIPTLGISLNSENIYCWVKFRGNTFIDIKDEETS